MIPFKEKVFVYSSSLTSNCIVETVNGGRSTSDGIVGQATDLGV